MTSLMLVAWLTRAHWQPRLPKNWAVLLMGVLVLSRALAFAGAFIVLDQDVPGDTTGFWASAARVHNGQIPFKDFSGYETPYNPGFYYFLALASSELQLQTLLSAVEVGSFVVLLVLFSRAFPQEAVQVWGVLYLLSPLMLWFSTLGGQEDTLILLSCSLGFLSFIGMRQRRLGSLAGGVIFALGFMFTKVLALIPLPLALGVAPDRRRAVIGYAVVAALSIPVALYLGADWINSVLAPGERYAAPTTWMVLNGITNGSIPANGLSYDILMLVCTWSLGSWLIWEFKTARRFRGWDANEQTAVFVIGWLLIWSVFGLLTSHGLAGYVIIWLPAAMLLLALQPRSVPLLLAVLAVNLVSNVQASVYFSDPGPYENLADTRTLALLGMDSLILASYVVFAYTAYRYLRKLRRGVALQPVGEYSSPDTVVF